MRFIVKECLGLDYIFWKIIDTLSSFDRHSLLKIAVRVQILYPVKATLEQILSQVFRHEKLLGNIKK